MIKKYRFMVKSISCLFIFLHSVVTFAKEKTSAEEERSYYLKSNKVATKRNQAEINGHEEKEHSLEPHTKLNKITKNSASSAKSNLGLSEESLIQEKEVEFLWPTLVSDNENWKQAAIVAAESWEITLEDYLQEANEFLKNYKVLYRKTKNLTDLIPLTKPLYSNERSRKFVLKKTI